MSHNMSKKIHMGSIVVFLIMVLYLISCTTIDPKYDVGPSFEEKLNSMINRITYDDALMTWGEPVSIFQGDEIFLATWGNQKSGDAVFPIGKAWFAMPIESGWKLQLSFDNKTRNMLRWIYEKW